MQEYTRVLLIDDSEADRFAYSRFLKQTHSNYTIVEAASGQQALAQCSEQQFDCILVDYNVPETNGLELIRLFRDAQKDAAVIMLTGQGNESVAVEAMQIGVQDYILKNDLSSERLDNAIIRAIEKVQGEKHIRKKQATLKKMAHHDPLTNILNRYAFTEAIEGELQRAARHRRRVALLFIDLDNFKHINDTMGHHMGDQVLVQATERIKQCIRCSDVFARLGGDEFAILLTDIMHNHDSGRVAAKVLASLQAPFHLDKHNAYIGASIGIASFPEASNEIHGLLKCADIAMYRAKEVGRNNYQYFSRTLNQKHKTRLAIEKALHQALENDLFYMVFQPQVDMRHGAIIAFEALLRCHDTILRQCATQHIIKVAEDTGLIKTLSDITLQKTRDAVAHHLNSKHAVKKVAINISPVLLMQSDMEQFLPFLNHNGNLDCHNIEIEISEAALRKHYQSIHKILSGWVAQGVQITLDDFGTDATHIQDILDLPVSKCKIDGKYIHRIDHCDTGKKLVKTLIHMARNLDMEVVGEGIETQTQAQFLLANHCYFGQGYYYYPPKDLI